MVRFRDESKKWHYVYMYTRSSAHMLLEGVKGLRGWEDGDDIPSRTSVIVVASVRVTDNAKWWKNRRHTYMLPEKEENWTKYTCTDKSTANLSPPRFFLGKVRTGHMRRMHMCSYACLFLKNKSRPLEKAKSRQQKNNEHSPPRDRGNLMSIKRFRSGLTCFDSFRCL